MPRNIRSINSDWYFCKLPCAFENTEASVHSANFDDSNWEQVVLPHTWNFIDGSDGPLGLCEGGEHYYRGKACYRRRLFLSSAECSNKDIFIEFGGVNTIAEVYINGIYVDCHKGGYSAFRFNISKLVVPNTENLITVTVSNAPTDFIAPITNQGDFTKMGGIYREVSLIFCNKIHIDLEDYGSSGVYITPRLNPDSSASVSIRIGLVNRTAFSQNVTVYAKVTDTDGQTVSCERTDTHIEKDTAASAVLELTVIRPRLWQGREDPYLYTLHMTLSSNGVIYDRCVQHFGIRTLDFHPEKGFFLNGKYLDLRGVNYHQDSFENGWAMTGAQRERDYAMMYDMGCSAVRMAHYQHGSHEYELCDRLGLCVWTEIGIVNKMSADTSERLEISPDFYDNAAQQLTELIRQNYNHPSVIVWGISNELWQMSDEIFDLYTQLYQLACREDSTRPKTFADSQFHGRFLELPADVVGYNRYFGWYKEAGPASAFGEWLDQYHTQKEKRPLCVSEYGGGGAISQHKDNIDWQSEIDPWGKRHFENYQSALHEEIWAQFSQRQYLWGKFVWCMFDFASDGRCEGDTCGLNDKGLSTRERIPKDAFFFYKSVWNPSPMVYITEKRFEHRPCDIPCIKVYSNADRVELFINGVSQGELLRSQLDPLYPTVFKWHCRKLETGHKNSIKAVARFGERRLEDVCCWVGE